MRGDGRIYSRSGSQFWWIGYYNRGEQVREVAKHPRTGKKLEATEENRTEARKFLDRRIREIANDKEGIRPFIGPQQERITINELLDALKADYELRGKWNDRVHSTVKRLREYFGKCRAMSVSSEDVAAFQLELREDDYRDATINRFCQVLGQSFNLAIENRRLSTGPHIKHLSEVGNERMGFFTETEIRNLISHLPEYLRDFALFAYITGMRKGEVQSLRWSDVTGDTITLQAANSKNGEGRTIPLEGELAEVIERRCEARKIKKGETVMVSEYVFHRKGEPIGSFRKAWSTACDFANVPGRLFHDLRRCAARNLLAAGVPQAVAMKVTGHKTDSMFRRYAIVTVDQQREALRAAALYRQQQSEKQKVQRIN